MATETTWSTQEVVKLTGATYRQVSHWAAQGFIPGQEPFVGSGQAYWRYWSREDLAAATALADCARFIDTRQGSSASIPDPPALALIAAEHLPHGYAIWDGQGWTWESDDWDGGWRGPYMVIPLREVI